MVGGWPSGCVARKNTRLHEASRRNRESTQWAIDSLLLTARTAVVITGKVDAEMEQQNEQIVGLGKILNNKVAVVTGAARGIGRAVAVALAQSGANVVGIDICAVVDPRSGVEPATRSELDETGG